MYKNNSELVSTELNDDLKSIIFAAIASQYNEKTSEQMFWEQHARAASSKVLWEKSIHTFST